MLRHASLRSLLVMLVLAATPAAARAQSAATPDAAARAFFAALEGRRWQEAVRLMHPAALARFREQTLGMARSEAREPARAWTAEELMRQEPGMPREVAEYQARRMAEGVARYRSITLEHAGVASLDELERLSPEETLARSLAARDERKLMERGMVQQGGDSTMAVLAARAVPRNTRTVIGSVQAGPDAAYVTYSIAFQSPYVLLEAPPRVALVGARRDGAGWKVDLGETFGHELFGGGNFSVSMDAQGDPGALRDVVRRTVEWPAGGSPRFRARMAGGGADPVQQPPTTLILERLAPNGSVAARFEIPADAWNGLSELVSLWTLLVMDDPHP